MLCFGNTFLDRARENTSSAFKEQKKLNDTKEKGKKEGYILTLF